MLPGCLWPTVSPLCPFTLMVHTPWLCVFLFLSQVERCYYFLHACVETAQRKESVDGRLVQFLLSNPTNDGGQWDMLVNLIGQFGLNIWIEILHFRDAFKLLCVFQKNTVSSLRSASPSLTAQRLPEEWTISSITRWVRSYAQPLKATLSPQRCIPSSFHVDI